MTYNSYRPADITRAILRAKNYNVATLAADLGVSNAVARRILNGSTDLNLSDLDIISTALGVTINFLVYQGGEISRLRAKRAGV